ncbi:phosphoglycerate kinase [Halobacteriales archaeon SW_7_68_16]|nr:MAG: phosphoglycerate kinase [Halobacteriales archaeon SW_7_68_16]
MRTLSDVSVTDRRVAVRVDVNSPVAVRDDDGPTPAAAPTERVRVADDARLRAHVDTLSELLDRDARVAVVAHQGRPGGDEFTSLAPHADRLDDLLDHPVDHVDATFSAAARDRIAALDPGTAVVLENTRFYSEEYMEFPPARAARTHLVAGLAPALDLYVGDAFAAAHRSQPSLVGLPTRVPGCAGRVMERELAVLGDIETTDTPRVFVLGGVKIDDSLSVARSVLERGVADTVLTAGVLGNCLLAARGIDVGDAGTETIHDRGGTDPVGRAGTLLAEFGDRIETPVDVAVADGGRREMAVEDLPGDGAPMDIGERTVAAYRSILADAGTAVLNGPAGVFEDDRFVAGTRGLFGAVAEAGYSIVGGGDTAAAIRRFGIEGFDHVSTGGGAALALLSGESLPVVEVLRDDD